MTILTLFYLAFAQKKSLNFSLIEMLLYFME